MTQSTNNLKGQHGSLIISAMFVVAGVIALYDTLDYTDRDSQVFPQTVAIILIVCASISFIMSFIKSSEAEGFGHGIWWRRVLLITTMVLTCIFMPIVGFLPASIVAFAGGLIAAMHDRWTFSKILVYWGSGGIIMVVFYTLFKFVLHVPLP